MTNTKSGGVERKATSRPQEVRPVNSPTSNQRSMLPDPNQQLLCEAALRLAAAARALERDEVKASALAAMSRVLCDMAEQL